MDFSAVLVALNLSAAHVAVYAFLPLIVMGLVAIVRGLKVPDPFLPILSVGFGIAGSMLCALMIPEPPVNVAVQIVLGVIAGLMASGMWSGGKTIGRAL